MIFEPAYDRPEQASFLTRVQTQWSLLRFCGHCQEHDLTKIAPR
jgi:hypothetical protein